MNKQQKFWKEEYSKKYIQKTYKKMPSFKTENK